MERELVIARYREDVSWVVGATIPTTVYNKGEPLAIDHDHVDIIELPNVGREAGSWLEHVVRNYDDLAGWTYFVQGSPHAGVAELFDRIAWPYGDSISLTAEYAPGFPSQDVKTLDRVEQHGPYAVRYGATSRIGNRPADLNRAWLDAIWGQWFDCPRPEDWRFGYGAEWAVPRHRITARPLRFWLWARDVASRPEFQAEMTTGSAWAFEAIWLYLFGPADRYPVKTPEARGRMEKTGSFVRSVARHVAGGIRPASEAAQESRHAICRACPSHDAARDRCLVCGCALSVKRSWASEACPEGKWSEES